MATTKRFLVPSLLPITLAALLGFVVLVSGCDDSSRYRAPTAPRERDLPQFPDTIGWVSYLVVPKLLSATGDDITCPSWIDDRAKVINVRIDGDLIWFDNELNALFFGSLRGREFEAAFAPDFSFTDTFDCALELARLEGAFDEGLGAFEAVETTDWKEPGQSARSVRSWTGRRCPVTPHC